jgi:hypothetical protein
MKNMNFPQNGTTATSINEPVIITPLSSLHITSTEAYDINQIFLDTSIQLQLLEMNSKGSEDEIETITISSQLLPRFSEERLELDFRVQSLMKKWGLIEKLIPETRKEITFPLEVSSLDNFLIENSNIEYIDSEKDGREWIIENIKKLNFSKLDSEKELNEILQEVIQELHKNIDNVHNSNSFSEWKSSLLNIGIVLSDEHYPLFEYWSTNERKKQKTIGQLKTWISSNEDKIFGNNSVTDTIYYNFIEKINL